MSSGFFLVENKGCLFVFVIFFPPFSSPEGVGGGGGGGRVRLLVG